MRVTMLFVVLLGAVALAPLSVKAEPKMGVTKTGATSTDLSSQRPRIRVQRGGRLLYRDCTFRLAQQMRPNGPVVVPVQRCWWVRG